MTTTDTKRISTQTASHMRQIRQGLCSIVDGDTVIAIGHLSIPQAALRLHEYKVTMAN